MIFLRALYWALYRTYGMIGALIVFAPCRVKAYALFALVIFLALIVNTHGHDIYHNWAMPDQRDTKTGKRLFGCCNNTDCAPRPSKWVNDHWEVQYQERWIKVPDQKVETNYPDAWDPKDHQSHACISRSGNVYCFRPGEWLQ